MPNGLKIDRRIYLKPIHGFQIEIIQAIDNNRYVWPHVLDEVSRSLPSYTWLTSMQQTSAAPVPPGADAALAHPLAILAVLHEGAEGGVGGAHVRSFGLK